MGIFDGIILASDLDGTLLGSSGEISRENLDAIEFFKREGGLFAIVTGRMPYYASDIYHRARSNAPLCCMNGGAIYDIAQGKYLWQSELDTSVKELLRFVDANFARVGFCINTYDKVYFGKENTVMQFFRDITGLPDLPCDYETFGEPMAKVVFGVETEEEMEAISCALRSHPLADRFKLVRSERYLFEVLPGGISKGVGLTKLAECLGIDMSKTVAVGDYNNDIELIESAGVGIAVANACDELKAVADMITVSNDEHAIAKIIEDIHNKNIIM